MQQYYKISINKENSIEIIECQISINLSESMIQYVNIFGYYILQPVEGLSSILLDVNSSIDVSDNKYELYNSLKSKIIQFIRDEKINSLI